MTLDWNGLHPVNQSPLQDPIRVLFVSHDGGIWGAQRTLMTLLSAIDRRMVIPLLVVPFEGLLSREAAGLGIPVFIEPLVHWIPNSFVSSTRQRLGHLYRFLRTLHQRCRAIESLIKKHRVDLVYTNTVTCIEGAIAARRTRKPHVWHIHEPILRNSELSPLFPQRVYCRAVNSLARSIIFCSKALAGEYPQISRSVSIVYNGLSFPPLRDRDIARAKAIKDIDLNPNQKLVAIVGAINPRKDHLTFLAAAEQVARKVEEVVFLVVGSGNEYYINLLRQRIRELQLSSRVRLLGWWEGDIFDFLAAMDVLVISSEQESFGLTAIEALSMETPVVSTRCGGPEEILVDGETGLLVPMKDPCALADGITRLLQDPKFARQLGIKGRNYVVEHFGIERYVESVQRVILETAAV